jgi:hypothetical protein
VVHRVDISADLNDEDETGYVWTFLDEARDASQIGPRVLVVAGDEEAAAVCQVIDLVRAGDGTIVHLRILSGLAPAAAWLAGDGRRVREHLGEPPGADVKDEPPDRDVRRDPRV